MTNSKLPNTNAIDQKTHCYTNSWSGITLKFKEALSQQGKQLPTFVEREFDDFLCCGSSEHGFLRVLCGNCKHKKLVAFGYKRN